MRSFSKLLALAIAVCALASPAQAQFAKSEDAVKYRKSAFFVMGQHFGRVAAMATGKVPFDANAVADNAASAEMLSKLPWTAFGEGTDKGDTKAKPEIWSDRGKFNDYAEKMQSEMAKLSVVAKTGNQENIKAAVAAVGSNCKGCHDAFRQ